MKENITHMVSYVLRVRSPCNSLIRLRCLVGSGRVWSGLSGLVAGGACPRCNHKAGPKDFTAVKSKKVELGGGTVTILAQALFFFFFRVPKKKP